MRNLQKVAVSTPNGHGSDQQGIGEQPHGNSESSSEENHVEGSSSVDVIFCTRKLLRDHMANAELKRGDRNGLQNFDGRLKRSLKCEALEIAR